MRHGSRSPQCYPTPIAAVLISSFLSFFFSTLSQFETAASAAFTNQGFLFFLPAGMDIALHMSAGDPENQGAQRKPGYRRQRSVEGGVVQNSVDSTLGQLMETAAGRFRDKPLVITADRTVSFAEMHNPVEIVAGNLIAMDIRAGDRVTLWMENSWQWIAAYFSVLRLGAVINPINILLTTDEAAYIAKDCGSKLVLTSSSHALALAGRVDIPVLVTQVTVDGEVAGRQPPLAHFDVLLRPRVHQEHCVLAQTTAQSVASIGYTSGTTGHPKGAVLTHRNIVTNALMTALMHGRTARDVIVSSLPCSHVYGNIVMNSAVASGATLVLLPRFDEIEVLRAIDTHRATMFEGVPTMFIKLMNHPVFGSADLSTLRICTVGGQTMPIATMQAVERNFGCRLLELWGMTEIGGLGMTHPHNGPTKLGSIGIPLPMVETRVLPVGSTVQPAHQEAVGELAIRGPIVMRGYLNDPDATRAVMDEQGWLRTGDLVRQDEDGYFFIVDRIKEVIINGGYNVYPAEVERVIAQLDAVAMVAVAAAKHELKGQVPKAFVVLKTGAACSAEEILRHCKAHLASYKVPSAVAFVADLPRNSTGKILRRALAESIL